MDQPTAKEVVHPLLQLNSTSSVRVLGITLGDVTGIGPEVTFKALKDWDPGDDAVVLIGNREVIRRGLPLVGGNRELPPWPGRQHLGPGLWQFEPDGTGESIPSAAGNAEAARQALKWLRVGARLCREGQLDGLVTAPVNKEAILRTGDSFVGQTEVVTEEAGSPPTAMMLLGTDERNRWLRVMLVTTHLPLRQVPGAITQPRLETSLRLADRACRELGLPRQRVAVCGLNPHAGEGGYLGTEELEVIRPAVDAARQGGMEVEGPLAADTVFHRAIRGEFEVVLAMYHDQGLAPLKLAAFDTGVNWTVGLPFVRTSPDHGTAYGIAGRGVANPSSMKAALALAWELVARR